MCMRVPMYAHLCARGTGARCRDQAPDRYAGPHEVAPAPGEAVPSQVTPEAAGRRALRSGWHRWSPRPSPGEGGGGRAGEGASRPPQSCGDPSGRKSVRELDGVCVASGPWGASSPRLWHASGGPGAGLVMCRSPAERSQPGAPTSPRGAHRHGREARGRDVGLSPSWRCIRRLLPAWSSHQPESPSGRWARPPPSGQAASP